MDDQRCQTGQRAGGRCVETHPRGPPPISKNSAQGRADTARRSRAEVDAAAEDQRGWTPAGVITKPTCGLKRVRRDTSSSRTS